MNIKKQIQNLYIYEIINGFRIVDVVWVFFLLQRGFSLAEAGIAEGVFHCVSMICEIPSGMISDTVGRKRTLVLAGLVSALSGVCMIVTEFFPLILVGMGLNALSYNLVSGTREALTYDSLLMAGEEECYLKIASRQEAIYCALSALSSLTSVVTVILGYKAAYLLSAAQGIICAVFAGRLKEAQVNGGTLPQEVSFKVMSRELKKHFLQSMRCLQSNSMVRRRMIVSGGISSGCYIMFMMMQEHLVDIGLNSRFIGILGLVTYLSSMAGAELAEKTRKMGAPVLILVCGAAAGILVAVCGTDNLISVLAAAGGAHCLAEMVLVRVDNENQKEFPSENRATMVSVGSMVYSILMVVLSPAAGAVADYFSIMIAFAALGSLMVGMTVCMSSKC